MNKPTAGSDSATALHQALVGEFCHLLKQSELRICHCIQQLTDQQIWEIPGKSQNSVGVLVRHICGNLTQWAINGTQERKDERDRAAEFDSLTKQSAAELLTQTSRIIQRAQESLCRLSIESWQDERQIQGFSTTILGAICHTVPHCVGHTHQIVQLTRWHLKDEYQFHWSENDPGTDIPL